MEETKLPIPASAAGRSPSGIGLLMKLGRLRRRQLKQLRRGEGPLIAEIQAVAGRQSEELGLEAGAQIVPVVLLYREAEPDYTVVTVLRDADDR